ncbi:hypothetical protein ABZV31_27510 [Streptomyces sp. NPDC005202]|uniref:DUF7144 family membrane protein n=1 Tax=Streptomyces sp. NPDC005202 TaxID=3157021 RepID=UPI0033B7A314
MTEQPHAGQPPTGGEGTPVGGEHQRSAGPAPGTGGRQTAAGPAPGTGDRPSAPGDYGWVAGGVVFAGVLMLVNGVLAILQGISAIAADDVYAPIGGYVYKINLTGWGWILVILGAVAVATGWGILKGAEWARMTGIFLASLSMIAQFMFLPYAPVWSVIMIALDFFVIWALAVYRPEGQQGHAVHGHA